jgi:peptide/nickel transport system permease protein
MIAAAVSEEKGYADIIWEQFRRYRLSHYGLYGVAALFVLAVFAPLISLNVPFVMRIAPGAGPESPAGLHFPWFSSLFDQNLFESVLDIFFNMMLFAAPLLFVAWRVQGKRIAGSSREARTRARTRFIGVSALTVALLFALLCAFGDTLRKPYVDYVELAARDGVRATFPPLRYSYRDVDLSAVGRPPGAEHLLGTDREGRDAFTRLLYGTRISLTIGVIAVSIYIFIGIVLGAVAGYFGGRTDAVILRLIEVMFCFPTFFLILTLRGFIDRPSIFHIMAIIGVTGWPRIARLVRGEFLRLKSQDFVQAAIVQGLPTGRVIFRHVLPNAMGPVLVAATFGVAAAILVEASLSFLGLGDVTTPSWGQILTTGRETHQLHLILAPGLAIFLTVSLLNLVGEGFRDATDPKLRS